MYPSIHSRRVGSSLGFKSIIVALLSSVFAAVAADSRLDLTRVVFIGDSLLACFQNSSLMASQQTNGIAALIARQGKFDPRLPLIAEPGIPNVLVMQDPGPPPIIVRSGGASSGRQDPTIQTLDLAVPGHCVIDALQKRPDVPFDSLTDMILGLPGLMTGISRSQVEWAEALAPTTIIVWIGNNDVLSAAIAGDATVATPVDAFRAAFTNLLFRLDATGAKLVMANIPDVTVIPYVMPVREAAALFDIPADTFSAALGISAHDYITLDAIAPAAEILQGTATGPLAPKFVLDAAEISTLQGLTAQYNEIIKTEAREKRAILVDTHAFLQKLDRHGVVVGARRLTTRFMGGIFSLDGVHPCNTGCALTANLFICEMNQHGKTHLQKVNVRQVARTDPLVPAFRH